MVMLFDTDILIWVQRGNPKAARVVDKTLKRAVSVQTYMELLQCARNKEQQRCTTDFLKEFNFEILPFTENIGHRASIYIEQYSLSAGIRTGDAIIAATAIEFNDPLCTGNRKHFKPIEALQLKIFRP